MISATGAGSLSSSPQPVTETPSALSLSGALRGLPADGGVPATPVPARRKAFPFQISHHASAVLIIVLRKVEIIDK